NYSEALNNYSASVNIRQELDDKPGVADSYNNIGLIYLDQGNYPEALKNYLQALKMYEALPGGNSSKRRIATEYINIGNVYLYQTHYPEALKNYSQALISMKEVGEKKGTADCYTNIGAIYYLQKNYGEALSN